MAESTFRREPVAGGVRFTFDVQTTQGEHHQKRATFGQFMIDCDEGPALGGTDSAPPPLAYFASSLAF